MSEDAANGSEGSGKNASKEDLMHDIEEIERQIDQYDSEELDTARIMEIVLAAGGTIGAALLIIRYLRKKKKKKRSFSFFNRPSKKDKLSSLLKQQAGLILIAIFRKEIVKLLQKLDVLDEGEFL